MMRTRLSIIAIAVSAISIVALGLATVMANIQAGEGVELGDVHVTNAYVVGIDQQDRTLSLLGPQGDIVTVEVAEEARNFNQIEVGDHVKITYYEAVAIYFGDHGTQPETDAGTVVARSPKGAKPAVYAVGAVDVSAAVQAIDRAKRTVALEGPDGHTHTVTVDPEMPEFDNLSVGDTIHARFTEAIAISVESPK